jgi:hypothetical protein
MASIMMTILYFYECVCVAVIIVGLIYPIITQHEEAFHWITSPKCNGILAKPLIFLAPLEAASMNTSSLRLHYHRNETLY